MGLISARLKNELCEKISEQKDKDDFIKTVLKESGMKCPCCNKQWANSDDEAKERITFRISEPLNETVAKIPNHSKFLAVAISMHLGVCPLCNQKFKK